MIYIYIYIYTHTHTHTQHVISQHAKSKNKNVIYHIATIFIVIQIVMYCITLILPWLRVYYFTPCLT